MRLFLSTVAGLAASVSLAVPAQAQEMSSREVQEQFSEGMRAEVDRLLDDPALPEKAGRLTEALVTILETVPIGQVEAAVEGREPTPDDMARTIGDVADLDGPALGAEVSTAIADNRHRVDAGMDALIATLPHLIVAVETLKAELEALERE